MVYITKIRVKGNYYFALAHNIRQGRQIKRISKYIGRTLPPKNKLEKIKAKFQSEVNALAEPELLSDKQKAILEKIRKNYLLHLKTLTPNDLEKLEEYILTNFTYNTNAIEGSKLTIADVMSVFEGATPEGKQLRDIYGAKNMRTAYNYLKTFRSLSQKRLLELHKTVMLDILATDLGKYRTVQVYVGKHIPPPSDKVPELMKDLFTWYRIAGKKLHPFELGCKFHVRFEHIHPFRDGNGRVGRLIMNFPLLKAGFPLLDITFENRPNYYRALEAFHAKESDMKGFIDYAFDTYVKMAKERRWL